MEAPLSRRRDRQTSLELKRGVCAVRLRRVAWRSLWRWRAGSRQVSRVSKGLNSFTVGRDWL